MKILINALVGILAFLALSSGATKLLLMQRDVEFFAAYGFTNPILIAFGAAHVIGGALLVVPRTRFVGAAIVGITFSISGVVLVLAGDIPVAIVTLAAVLALVVIMKLSHRKVRHAPATLTRGTRS